MKDIKNLLIDFDLRLINNFINKLSDKKIIIIGVDEAGRGCLAGDVFAGAVYFENFAENFFKIQEIKNISEVNDSKKLTENSRQNLAEIIKNNTSCTYGIGSSSVDEINKLGILRANSIAMERAVKNIFAKNNNLNNKNIFAVILIDGITQILDLNLNNLNFEQITLKKADSKSFHVACASILAKTSRDIYIKKLSEKYPEYLWHKNKGYGTETHRNLILKHGACELHRKLFLRNLNSKQEQIYFDY